MAQGGGIAAVRKGLCRFLDVGAPEVLFQSGVKNEIACCKGEYIFTLRVGGIKEVVRFLLYQDRWHL